MIRPYHHAFPGPTQGLGDRSRPIVKGRLNLDEINAALEDLALASSENPKLWKKYRREDLSQDVVRRLGEAYAYVDWLLSEDIDPFSYGNSSHLLELNHIVLCGTSNETRSLASDHMKRTEESFYEVRPGGIGTLTDWFARHLTERPDSLAIGCFVMTASSPQLFIEGNQRTATLISSLVLLRGGMPPIVVTRDNYQITLPLFAEVKALDRSSAFTALASWRIRRRLLDFYRLCAEWRFMRFPPDKQPDT